MRTLGVVVLAGCLVGCDRHAQPQLTSSAPSVEGPRVASAGSQPSAATSASMPATGLDGGTPAPTLAASGTYTHGDAIAAIDAGCAPAEKLAREATSVDEIFANVQVSDTDPGTWQRFASVSELRRRTKDRLVYDSAVVWQAGSAWTLVAMTLSSASGDWVQFVDYCYRPTGTNERRRLSTAGDRGSALERPQ